MFKISFDIFIILKQYYRSVIVHNLYNNIKELVLNHISHVLLTKDQVSGCKAENIVIMSKGGHLKTFIQ